MGGGGGQQGQRGAGLGALKILYYEQQSSEGGGVGNALEP